MRYITDLSILILSVSGAITVAKDSPGGINYGVLAKCKGHGDCLPWQTCATCTSSTNRPGVAQSVKYCSDFNFRGLCGYHDNDLSCTCTETMNDSHRAYMSGKCTSDQYCNEQYSPTDSRCAICVDHFAKPNDPKTFTMCTTSPAIDKKYSLCAQNWCSCGQVYQDLDKDPGIWDQQQSMLDQNQFNAAANSNLFASSSIQPSDQVDDQSANSQQTWSQDNRGQFDPSSLEQLGVQPNEVQYGFSNLEPNEIRGSEQYGFST